MRVIGLKKFIHYLILSSWLTSLVVSSTVPAFAHTIQNHQSQSYTSHTRPLATGNSIDPDFDGLPTSVEEAGWYGDGGLTPYVTDPNDPDSDDDGLTDGEEQLYGTNPNDPKDPGLYVVYQNEFQTKKFYPWQQDGAVHANRYIVHSSLPNNIGSYVTGNNNQHDVIVRRGNLLHVGTPPGATLTVEPNSPNPDHDIFDKDINLTPLAPISNVCGGGWAIPIPADATAGSYTITASDGAGWEEELSLYVIFELDTPYDAADDLNDLTQDHIDVLGYDDDLNETRDEVTIYWDTSYEYQPFLGMNPNPYRNNHPVYGWGIGWDTDFTEQYVFEEHVMTAIQNQSDRDVAAWAVISYTDSILDFDALSFPNSTKKSLVYSSNFDLHPEWDTPEYLEQQGVITDPNDDAFEPNGIIDADCNGNASLAATFLKAAGFTARPIAVDWRTTHYDTATEVWLDGEWMVQRAYKPQGSSGDLRTREQFGSKYSSNNDLLLVSGPNWTFDQININYDDSTHEVEEDYRTDRVHDANLYPVKPPSMTVTSIISRWDWVETPIRAYWPGYEEPDTIANCSGDICESGGIGSFEVNSTSIIASTEAPEPTTAQFKEALADYGIDLDGDGRFDQFAIEIEVEVLEAGQYYIEGRINDLDPETRLGAQIDAIDQALEIVALEPGLHTIPLTFDGRTIGNKEADGPYILEWVRIATEANPEPHMSNGVVDEQWIDYITANYDDRDFEGPNASLSGVYSHDAQDTNGDGYIDRIVFNANLDIIQAGDFTLEASLVDATGKLIERNFWTGSGSQASITFDHLLGRTDSYFIRDVTLYGGNGEAIAFADEAYNANAGGYVYEIGSLYSSGIQTQSGETLSVTGSIPVDNDSDGDYDQLNFPVKVNISAGGQYKVEGWLESSTGALIALRDQEENWSSAGNKNTTLSFDGGTINDFAANGPYKLIGLKLFLWNGATNRYDVLLEDGEPANGTTSAYSFSEFDGGTSVAMFDGVEGDTSYWNLSDTDWSVTNEASRTPSQSWTDSPGSNYSSGDFDLTANSIALTNDAIPTVSFYSCHAIDSGDTGLLQIKTDNTSWATIATYNGTQDWQYKQVNVTEVVGVDSFEFRFRLSTNGTTENGWYVDDVMVTLDEDADDDGLSNMLEGAASETDTDGDDIPDYLDPDSDNDGISDEDEGSGNLDGDQFLNFRDTDSDNDGILDADEGSGDIDGDGFKNFEDTDADGDDIPDQDEGSGDTDDDGIPDFLDTDADGDNIPDKIEGTENPDGDELPNYLDPDSDGDGFGDGVEGSGDADADGLKNFEDTDSDGDGILDEVEGNGDMDGDGKPNYQDTDSDGDGKPDIIEGTGDANGNGIPDYLDRGELQIFLPLLMN